MQSGTSWGCKLDGMEGCYPFKEDSLHAIEAPAADKALDPFQPVQLAHSLPLAEVPGWLREYQQDPPVDLVRKKPDSSKWFEVLTCQTSTESLSDEDVSRLRYMAAGGAPTASGQQHSLQA
jgi:hypothetical protein